MTAPAARLDRPMLDTFAVVGRNVPPKPGLAPDADLAAGILALLDDPPAEARPSPSRGTLRRLSQIRNTFYAYLPRRASAGYSGLRDPSPCR